MEPGLRFFQQFTAVFSQRHGIIKLDLQDIHLVAMLVTTNPRVSTRLFTTLVIIVQDPHPPPATLLINFNLDLTRFDPPLQRRR